MKYKRIIVAVIAICLCTGVVPVDVMTADAKAEVSIEDSINKIGETGGYLTGSIKTVTTSGVKRIMRPPTLMLLSRKRWKLTLLDRRSP